MSIRITKWNMDAFEELRRSPKVQTEVERVARIVAQRAGRGYEWSARQGRKGPPPAWNRRKGPGFQGRYRAIVYPDTFRAMRDNAKNNTLVKLVGGGGW